MGILNATPDSFYDGGKYNSVEAAIAQGNKLISEGADLLDIGGESTRPGAEPVPLQEELARVIPVIEALAKTSPIPISIDTKKPEVAAAALKAGAALINDVTGLTDPRMRKLAADTGVQVCVMHMRGTPQDMQNSPDYPEGIIPHLCSWFEKQIRLLKNDGIQPQQLILDPGIGFGKTVAHNHEILHNLPRLKAIGFPLLIGVSRKSLIVKTLNKPPESLLGATIALNTWAILHGVDYIRVHDVQEHRDAVDLLHRAKYQVCN